MAHERTRRVKVRGQSQPTMLDNYRCPNCHAMLREGNKKADDIWLSPLFREAV